VGHKADKPRVPGLDSQLVAQWLAVVQITREQHKLEGKIAGTTDMSVQQFEDTVKFLKIIGKMGQEQYRDCLSAKSQFDGFSDSVVQLGDTFGASDDLPRFRVDLPRCPQHSSMDRGHSSVLDFPLCCDQQILIHPDAQLRWQLHEP
jgi:hypothetical protein